MPGRLNTWLLLLVGVCALSVWFGKELVQKIPAVSDGADPVATQVPEYDLPEDETPAHLVVLNGSTRPGLARKIGDLAAEVGLAITPPGATFPYGRDPQDCNLRIAPTFARLEELKTAMEVFALCVKLASVRDEIEKR